MKCCPALLLILLLSLNSISAKRIARLSPEQKKALGHGFSENADNDNETMVESEEPDTNHHHHHHLEKRSSGDHVDPTDMIFNDIKKILFDLVKIYSQLFSDLIDSVVAFFKFFFESIGILAYEETLQKRSPGNENDINDSSASNVVSTQRVPYLKLFDYKIKYDDLKNFEQFAVDAMDLMRVWNRRRKD